jgi:hypothetical protein
MHRMQIRERLLDAHQVHFTKPAANIHVARDQSDAMRHCRKSADQNELDMRRNQSSCQFT